MGIQSKLERIADEFYTRAIQECTDDIANSTVAFFGHQGDELKQDRTGVLLQISDDHFFITAAHYLDGITKHDIPCFIATGSDGQSPIPLDDVHGVVTDPLLDIAVIHLSEGISDSLAQHKRFLRMCDLDLVATSSVGIYMVFGYPLAWSDSDKQTQSIFSCPLRYGTLLYDGPPASDSNYTPEKHILLGYDQIPVEVMHCGTVTPPDVKGMSGCGIWRLAQSRPGLFESWMPSERRLVGIQHAWHASKGYLKGTWIKHAIHVIYQQFSELRRPILIEYPGAGDPSVEEDS